MCCASSTVYRDRRGRVRLPDPAHRAVRAWLVLLPPEHIANHGIGQPLGPGRIRYDFAGFQAIVASWKRRHDDDQPDS
jgi:hypothetical protein